uniref:Uncharacterized protein n=1 Tax=Arundo donax TaxID=35708 RepID=A0A0A9H4M0_ARUDO
MMSFFDLLSSTGGKHSNIRYLELLLFCQTMSPLFFFFHSDNFIEFYVCVRSFVFLIITSNEVDSFLDLFSN